MRRAWGRRDRRRGFTLVELLVVILIIAILMAVAMPLYLSAVINAEIRTCRANMQSIANADQAFRARDAAHQYTTDMADLPLDLGSFPVCPRGGAYTISISDGTAKANNGSAVAAGGLVVSCSAAGHGIFAPGVDAE